MATLQSVSASLTTLLASGRIRPKRVRLDLIELNASDEEEVFRRLDLDADDDLILGGSIQTDATRDVWRTLTLNLSGSDTRFRPAPGADIWVDKRVQVYIGYKLADGTTEWVPAGRYIWEDPEYVHRTTTKQVNLTAYDKAGLVTGQPRGGFSARTTVASGTNIKTAIKALADSADWLEKLQILATVSETTPYKFEWAPGDSPWQAARELAGIPADPSYVLYYGPAGYLTFKSDPAQATASPVISYDTAADSDGFSLVAGELTVRPVTSEMINHYIVHGLSTARPPVPILGEATDTDATSPARIALIGRRVRVHRPDPDRRVTTQQQADDLAAYWLRKLRQPQQRVIFAVVEDPRLEPLDVIQIQDGDAGVSGRYQVLRITLPLKPTEGRMIVEAVKVIAS